MSSPAERSKIPKTSAARVAELRLQLMARRDLMAVQSKSTIFKIKSQNSVGSMSNNSTSSNTVPRFASTTTPPAPQKMNAALNAEEEAQKLQKDLKELQKIIAFGAAKAPALNTAKSMKLSHNGPFAPKHTTSIPPKPSTNMTGCKKTKAKEAVSAIPKEAGSIKEVGTNDDDDNNNTSNNDDNATAGSPSQDITGAKSHQVQPNDDGKDLDDDKMNKPQPEEQGKPDRIKAETTQEDDQMQPTGPQASIKSNMKEGLLPSAPLSKSIILTTPASTARREQTSHHPTKPTLQLQKSSLPQQPVNKPVSQDETPPTAPHSHKHRSWEFQHYRRSPSQAEVDRAHDRRGNTRRSLDLAPLAPHRPDFPNHKHPRNPYFEYDKPTSQDRDLDDWLAFTGWHNRDYRADFLHRKRRLAYLDREKDEIEQERAVLMSADERALRFETGDYHGRAHGADEYEADTRFRNAGRELFGSTAPGGRRKREYTSDGELHSPRKMSRVDIGEQGRRRRRDLSRGPNDLNGARGNFLGATRRKPDHLASLPRRPTTPPSFNIAHRGQRHLDQGGRHSSVEDRFRRDSSSWYPADEEPSPFSSARLQNPRSPMGRGGRGGRGGYGAFKRGA